MTPELKQQLLNMAREQGITATTIVDEDGRRQAVLKRGEQTLLSIPAGMADRLKRKLTLPEASMSPAAKLLAIMVNQSGTLSCDEIGCTTCGAMPVRGLLKQFDWCAPEQHNPGESITMFRASAQNNGLKAAIADVDLDKALKRTTIERILKVFGLIVLDHPRMAKTIEGKVKDLLVFHSADPAGTSLFVDDWRCQDYRDLTPAHLHWMRTCAD